MSKNLVLLSTILVILLTVFFLVPNPGFAHNYAQELEPTTESTPDSALEISPEGKAKAELYVVNFTAEWCPNCKVLDPALEQALSTLSDQAIQHIVLDMTGSEHRQASFEAVNGTVLGGVYGDYVGLTGLVVMVAVDSGEKIDCATRLVGADGIALSIRNALEIVRSTPAGTRETDSILCPPANRKILVQ